MIFTTKKGESLNFRQYTVKIAKVNISKKCVFLYLISVYCTKKSKAICSASQRYFFHERKRAFKIIYI